MKGDAGFTIVQLVPQFKLQFGTMTVVDKRSHRSGILLLLILLGFALRVYRLDAMSFWADEVLTPLRSALTVREILSNHITLQGVYSQDTHPPLYFLIIRVTRQLLGTSDFAYRFVAVVFGTLTIPMMARFGRSLFTPRIGLLAAAITTINPLQIWYAQEARMYTLLVLCMLIATYYLWQAWQAADARQLPRWIGGYLIFAGFAVYTHYTAAFLILAQGIIWLWILWRKQLWKLVIGVIAVAILASLPLIPVVIPRLLTGVEASYSLVSPQTFFLDVVRGFGFGRTADHSQPVIFTLQILLTIILIIGVWYTHHFRRTFLLIYMLAATVGLLAGSYIFKPMYLGPHHMMVGSPAFMLLLAVAVAQIRPKSLTFLLAAVIVTAQLTSLNNLYNNPQFAKDNFRDLIRYIDARATEHDQVVYNNATLMPMQAHYSERPDLPYTTIPAYTTFVTDEALDALAATTAERIWFVNPPPQYPGDDDLQVRATLDEQFFVADRHWFHGNNAEMLVSAFAPRIIGAAPKSAESTAWQGARLPALNAQRLTRGTETVWADFWWQLDNQPIETVADLHFELRAPDGSVWQRGIWDFWGMEDSAELADQLPASAPIHTNYALQLPAALPQSTYQLWIRSDADPNEWHNVGGIDIDHAPEPQLDTRRSLLFDNGVELVGLALAVDSVNPGNGLPFTAYWRITQPLTENWHYRLRVGGRDGLIHEEAAPIFPTWIAPAELPLDTLIALPLGIIPPSDMEPGELTLAWAVELGGVVSQNRPKHRPNIRPWRSDVNNLGSFTVEPFPLITDLPDVTMLQSVGDNQFGNAMTLAGYEINTPANAAGEPLALTLYWEALATLPDDYWVFLHFSAEVDQPPLTSSNSIPVNGSRPINGWRVGEILQDERTLTLPTDLPSGDYTLLVGFYHPVTGQRLPVTQNGTAQPHDQLPIMTITLP